MFFLTNIFFILPYQTDIIEYGLNMSKSNQKLIKQQIEENRHCLTNLINNNTNVFYKDIFIKFILRHLSSENAILCNDPNKNITDNKHFNEYFNQCTDNVKDAWNFVYQNINQPIDFYTVIKLHSILINNTEVNPGLRRYDVRVLDKNSPAPERVMYLLNDILFKLKNEQLPPMTRAFNLHFDMIKTQPFEDCNKRLARLLMNWFLIKHGYTPILFNKKNDNQDYIQILRDMDTNNATKIYSQYMYAKELDTQKQLLHTLTHKQH